MSRRALIYMLVAAALAAAAVIGVVASAQGSSPPLPTMSPAQVLAKVASEAKAKTAVSGGFAWSNGLIPGSDLTSLLSGQTTAPTSLASLALGGSGRLWVQQGSGVRLEAQGNGSDFVLVAGKSGIWTYSSATSTAVNYTLPAGTPGASTAPSPSTSPSAQASAVDPLTAITKALQRFAATGTVTVGNDTKVAGRPSYLLVVTPAAGATTSIGSLQVAIDGKTFVPLRVQVFSKGATSPTLSAGFKSVSYAKNAASLFTFSPPAGATVQHKALPSFNMSGGTTPAPTTSVHSLTLAQAQAKAKSYGLTLTAPAQSASLPFAGAAVLPPAQGRPATAVLHYGKGFGSVVLAETTGGTGTTAGSLSQTLARLPHGLVTTATIGGQQVHELSTALIDVAVWQHGGVTLVAAGLVPSATLQQFVASVH